MIEVVLEYKLFNFIPLTFKREIPQEWSQLTSKQMEFAAKVFYAKITDAKLVQVLLRIPGFVAKKLHPFHIFSLVEHLDFLYEFKARDSFAIPEMGDGVAPQPRLKGVTFGHFIYIDSYFQQYSEHYVPLIMDKFLAALYLPKGQKFDENDIDRRAKIMAKESYYKKQAVLINYRLFREWLHIRYHLVFPKKEESKTQGKEPKKKLSNPKAALGSWVKIFDALVGDDIANSHKYENMPLHQALRYIQDNIKKNAKRKV